MHKHYIINGIVEFHPATGTLREIENPEHVVVLNSPAGRCLLLLIERIGSIVTQQEFLDSVWQRRGMQVSPNTFYQNISILRKGLKKFGFATDPIVTIPRIGLTLASDTEIIIRESHPVPQHQPPVAEKQSSAVSVETTLPNNTLAEASALTEQIEDPALSSRHSLRLVVVLLILLMLFGVGIINQSNSYDSLFEDGYRFAALSGSCRIYLANDIQTQSEREKALAYVLPFADECVSHPWIYVSWYAMLPRASVIRCDRPMTEPNRCLSDYFIEDH